MSVEPRKMTSVGLGLLMAALGSGVCINFISPELAQAKAVRKSKAPAASGSTAPAPSNSADPNAVPRWVQYDQGGMYYLSKGEIEKARNYFLSALKEAEAVVPRERATGLKDKTVFYCCNLINHLQMFIGDKRFKAPERTLNAASYRNPLQFQYDVAADQLKRIRTESEWLDRVESFANRALGKEHRCLQSLLGSRKRLDIDNQNTKFQMTQIEQQLRMTQSAIDRRPLNNGTSPGTILQPNGEYLPPGGSASTGSGNY